MALIEGNLRIQNYCALRDVTLGRIGTVGFGKEGFAAYGGRAELFSEFSGIL